MTAAVGCGSCGPAGNACKEVPVQWAIIFMLEALSTDSILKSCHIVDSQIQQISTSIASFRALCNFRTPLSRGQDRVSWRSYASQKARRALPAVIAVRWDPLHRDALCLPCSAVPKMAKPRLTDSSLAQTLAQILVKKQNSTQK